MRIGLIDIDTSHPAAWIPLLRDMGHEIAAIWDGGSVHSPRHVQDFAKEHGIDHVAAGLDEVIPLVDCAIIHSCNWDLHVERARPFVEAGKSVMVDKPLAGKVADIQQLIAWAEKGARITGGSSLRCTVEGAEFLARPAEERGEPRVVLTGCGTDEFNYGIHAYAMLWSIMGPGAVSARWLADRPQWMVEVVWDERRRGVVSMAGEMGWLPSYATIVTEKGVHHIRPLTKPDPLYKTLLVKSMPYLAGRTDQPPVPMSELIEPELAAVAALESRRRAGEPMRIDELSPDTDSYDGEAFARQYKAAQGK